MPSSRVCKCTSDQLASLPCGLNCASLVFGVKACSPDLHLPTHLHRRTISRLLRTLPSLSMVLSQSIPTSELHRVLAGVMGVSLTPIIKSLSKPYRSPLVPSTGCYKRSDGDSLISHLTLTLYLVLGELSSQIDTTLYLFPSITSSPYTLRGRVVTG